MRRKRDASKERKTILPHARCQFITGDVKADDWFMCGEPVCERGSAKWCEEHAGVVYDDETDTKWKKTLKSVKGVE